MNFKEFLEKRLNQVPYDLNRNPFGFKHTFGSDISAHLPLLMLLAKDCNHITEFGTRECFSTVAFLCKCKGKVVSYDIEITKDIKLLQTLDLPCEWQFFHQSTIEPSLEIEPTDLLFLDTDHTYQQVETELSLHATKAKKYLVFHDTYSFPEIMPAISEFLYDNSNWNVVYKVDFNHGLLVLENDRS